MYLSEFVKAAYCNATAQQKYFLSDEPLNSLKDLFSRH
jgi:hypothetical protein